MTMIFKMRPIAILFTALLLATPAASPAAEGIPSAETNYPSFSWDTVQVWCPLRNSIAYTEDDIRQMAAHKIVMLEKANGHESYGSVERGVLEAACRIKKVNPSTKVLFYWNAVIDYHNYAACKEFDQHKEEWALKKGGKIWLFKNRYMIYDNREQGLKDWWVKTATEMAAHPEIDGIFIDAICKTVPKSTIYPYEDSDQQYVRMAEQLRNKLPKGKLLIGNALRATSVNGNRQHLDYLDGSYLERWTIGSGKLSDADAIASGIELMREALKKGKIIMLTATPSGATVDEDETPKAKSAKEKEKMEAMPGSGRLDFMRKNLTFPLAVFLVCAEKHAYFSYHSGVDANPKSTDIWDNNLMPELKRPLGKPLSDPVKNGYEYTRSFEHVDVWVNIKTREAKLNWK